MEEAATIEETLVLEWTTAVEALDSDGIRELFDIRPELLWTPLLPLSHLESDFAHFIRRLEQHKRLGTSIRPVYALHHILYDYGVPDDEWAPERIELVDYILKNTKGNELNTCFWGDEQNTATHLAYFLDQPELIQQLKEHGALDNIPNKSGHLPLISTMDEDATNSQPDVKLLINNNKAKSVSASKDRSQTSASDRFKRLRELAESPSANNKPLTERQNSTRRYFRPGHLEERRRRVLSEEEEAELEKQRLKRQKEVEQLAQRSAVRNNPLFKKFEEHQQQQQTKRTPSISAASAVRDRKKLLGAADQIRRTSRVINSLKDRSYVSTSVFRQAQEAEAAAVSASKGNTLNVPTLAQLRAGSPIAKDVSPYVSDNEEEEEEKPTVVEKTNITPTKSEEKIATIKEEAEGDTDNNTIHNNVSDSLSEDDDKVTSNKKEDSTTTSYLERKSNDNNRGVTEDELESLSVGRLGDREISSNLKTKKKEIDIASSKVKDIVNVHEHLNDEEEVEIHSVGKKFAVWKKNASGQEEDEESSTFYKKNSSGNQSPAVDSNSTTADKQLSTKSDLSAKDRSGSATELLSAKEQSASTTKLSAKEQSASTTELSPKERSTTERQVSSKDSPSKSEKQDSSKSQLPIKKEAPKETQFSLGSKFAKSAIEEQSAMLSNSKFSTEKQSSNEEQSTKKTQLSSDSTSATGKPPFVVEQVASKADLSSTDLDSSITAKDQSSKNNQDATALAREKLGSATTFRNISAKDQQLDSSISNKLAGGMLMSAETKSTASSTSTSNDQYGTKSETSNSQYTTESAKDNSASVSNVSSSSQYTAEKLQSTDTAKSSDPFMSTGTSDSFSFAKDQYTTKSSSPSNKDATTSLSSNDSYATKLSSSSSDQYAATLRQSDNDKYTTSSAVSNATILASSAASIAASSEKYNTVSPGSEDKYAAIPTVSDNKYATMSATSDSNYANVSAKVQSATESYDQSAITNQQPSSKEKPSTERRLNTEEQQPIPEDLSSPMSTYKNESSVNNSSNGLSGSTSSLLNETYASKSISTTATYLNNDKNDHSKTSAIITREIDDSKGNKWSFSSNKTAENETSPIPTVINQAESNHDHITVINNNNNKSETTDIVIDREAVNDSSKNNNNKSDTLLPSNDDNYYNFDVTDTPSIDKDSTSKTTTTNNYLNITTTNPNTNNDEPSRVRHLEINTNKSQMIIEEESDEDEATTPTMANPHTYQQKKTTTATAKVIEESDDEETRHEWKSAYDSLMSSQQNIDFEDDIQHSYLKTNNSHEEEEGRPSFSSDLDETSIIQTLSYQNEARLDNWTNKNPMVGNQPSNDENANQQGKKRQSGSQRNHWSTGIQHADVMKRESMMSGSVANSSEAGSEQWFDPDDDWTEQQEEMRRQSLLTSGFQVPSHHNEEEYVTNDDYYRQQEGYNRHSDSSMNTNSETYSYKNSNSTENTTHDEDDEDERKRYHQEIEEEDDDYYSTNLHTDNASRARGESSYYHGGQSDNDQEQEGEIVVFMDQFSSPAKVKSREMHKNTSQESEDVTTSYFNNGAKPSVVQHQPPKSLTAATITNFSSSTLSVNNIHREDDELSLIKVPSRTIAIAEAGGQQEYVPHDPNNPRVEDISHYMNKLPAFEKNNGEAALRGGSAFDAAAMEGGGGLENEAVVIKRAISTTQQSGQPIEQNRGIPNAHEIDSAFITSKRVESEDSHKISMSSLEATSFGKMYIGVSGAHNMLLPLPKEITYVRCVISDGEYEYMSRYEILGYQILMDYECVIDTRPGMIITVSLHVRPDYHVKPRTGWSRWLTSIRKQKEHLSGYVHPEDGAIGQTRFAVDHMVPGCYKKTYEAHFDCFNSWYARTARERQRREQFGDDEDFLKIVGKLNVEMLYLPVSNPSVQVPRSLRECDLTLKIRQWHDTCWQSGYLSTRRQGLKIWERHYYRLIGSQLIGYTSEGGDRQVWDHYNMSDVIRLSAAADKVIVTLMNDQNDDKVFGADPIHAENHKGFFRLAFPDYNLDCVSDDLEESEEWVKTLKSMIGRVPLRLPFSD